MKPNSSHGIQCLKSGTLNVLDSKSFRQSYLCGSAIYSTLSPYWSAQNDFTPYLLLSLLDILDTPESWSLWDLEVLTATLSMASPDLTQWQVSVALYGPFNPTFFLPPKPVLEGAHPHIIQFCCQLEMQPWHPLSHRVLTLRKCFLEIFTSVTLVSYFFLIN